MIGEDTMVDLPNWRKPDKVFSLCQFIVCCRSTEEPKRHPVYEELLQRGAKLRFLSLPPRDVSSTAIRKALAAGDEPVGLSPQVMEYILSLIHISMCIRDSSCTTASACSNRSCCME